MLKQGKYLRHLEITYQLVNGIKIYPIPVENEYNIWQKVQKIVLFQI